MSSRKTAHSERKLAAAIAVRLRSSLLPVDAPFTEVGLAEAAHFLLAAAQRRGPGEAAVALESVTGPVRQRLTRIAAVNDNMPFLVDSVAATIAAHGLSIDRLVHPVVAVRRDSDGRLEALPEGDAAGGARESLIYVETSRADARTRIRLAAALETTLADVRAAVSDWPLMQAAMAADADMLEEHGEFQGVSLLRWLKDGMLTQLGHVLRHRDGRQEGALGICRASTPELLRPDSFQRAFAWFERPGVKERRAGAPLIVKSNQMSRVHRQVPLDLFIVPLFEGGRVKALSVHAGVWTSAALATAPDRVPRLCSKLSALMDKFGFDSAGHAGKALVHAMTALPHDLLISFDDVDLERVATSMMSLVDQPRPRVVLVRAPLGRHLFVFVWLPRDSVSTSLRQRIVDMLETAAGAQVIDWSLQVEGSTLAMLRFVLDTREQGGIPDEAKLDAALQAMVRGWTEAVEAELSASEEPTRAAAIAARFAEAFPPSYRTTYGPTEAAADIQRLRRLAVSEDEPQPCRDARLYRLPQDTAGQLRLKLYQRCGALTLSDAVPLLENFGFRVLGEVPTLLGPGEAGAIHDFQLALAPDLGGGELLARAGAVEAAIAAVLNGAGEDDAFNRLIPAIGLSVREAMWLRAWFRYLRQAGMPFALSTVVDALQAAPRVTRGLIDLFLARHDPEFRGERQKAEAAASEAIREGLSRVSAINDDRLLRRYRALVEAILRTNAFLPEGLHALAFKLDCALVPGLPKPVPWREIFVYSRQVEGIHLRAGPIARGGIRWSDRRDDFRTEILGLMKAQRVKNAVIVPTGAKGGFYPKQLPDPTRDREGWLAEGRASYQLFVHSLLSLTDNVAGDDIVHPRNIVIRDGEDPYFVVAADKGTASFSDTANAIAAQFDFWLEDAFASGGSKGYDHKAMGITARGAWLSVQRHFLEMGVDVQKQSIRVCGCGDMSGDVFGNGMLLSKAIKLVAAFDHRHIFIDPDPDPANSWAERQRLFALPRSSWDDYNRKLLSKGGGIYPRSLKQIPLSAKMRSALAIEAESADPETLIAAILRAPVDLLWFGGIGTYVKASSENNVAVGDPTNDALRVDGRDIRAKVIGEGANLGSTQAGRIEFALSGGRINTDFIDNSAGVDCSDHEVNIKIALAAAKRAGRLSEKGRVALLSQMTDEVAALVLEDNRLQALALSIAQADGAPALASYARVVEMLEERGQLDRRTEGLADSDVLLRRVADGAGLTRPELAVLLSSAKLALQEAIVDSALPDDPGLTGMLLDAFPPAMRSRFQRDILKHRLRREIISTKLANRMVNQLGVIHPFELVEEEGATLAQVAAVFAAAEQLFAMADIWQAIETTPAPEQARVLLFNRAAIALRSHMADLLRAGGGDALRPSALVSGLGGGVQQLSAQAADLLQSEAQAQSARLRAEFALLQAPAEVAARVVHLFDIDGVVGLARLARETGIAAPALTLAFGKVGARLGLDWAQATAARMNPSDPWEKLLVAGLARDFQQMRIEFLRRAIELGRAQGKADPLAAVDRWSAEQASAITQFRAMTGRASAAVPVTPAMLAQIAGQARSLLGR